MPACSKAAAALHAMLAVGLCAPATPAGAQAMPVIECGKVQANAHIRCTAIGAVPFTGDQRAGWVSVPHRESFSERYLEAAECHASTEAGCDEVSNLPSSYSTVWKFEQSLGSYGCEEGATGNGWIDPYVAWRAALILPKRADKTWMLTIVANTVTEATIKAYPNAAAAVEACHLTITGVGTSKGIAIARAGTAGEQREIFREFAAGDYLAELRCPAIQGSDCQPGKASLTLQITISPSE
jgi:hypothetical protein